MEHVPYRFGAPVEPPWFCDREGERRGREWSVVDPFLRRWLSRS